MLLLSIKITEADAAQHKASLQALTAYMKIEYPGLTTGDLVLAYRLGVKCKLGIEMFAELNPRSVGKVLDAYEQFKREELTRNPAPMPQPAGLLPEAIPTPAQQDKANAQLIGFAYQAHQQGRTYQDHGNLLYNFLDARGLISYPTERKWEFMKQAQQQIFNEKANHGASGNMQEHKDARNVAALLKQAQDQNQLYLPEAEQVKTRAKQIAFTTLINDLIAMQTTPDEFLTSNQ